MGHGAPTTRPISGRLAGALRVATRPRVQKIPKIFHSPARALLSSALDHVQPPPAPTLVLEPFPHLVVVRVVVHLAGTTAVATCCRLGWP